MILVIITIISLCFDRYGKVSEQVSVLWLAALMEFCLLDILLIMKFI